MLDELCDELYRNGFDKIIFVDGHGGNTNFLKYFMQSRLEEYHPYITYYFDAGNKDSAFWKNYQEKFGRVLESGHACEFEASSMMAINKDLMKMDRINPDETKAMHRLDYISNAGLYTGIGWYADYPNQVAGDPTNATIERGQYINEYNISRLVNAIKVVKNDNKGMELLNEYYDKHTTPEEF
jgi:creatinine amidohydrolase